MNESSPTSPPTRDPAQRDPAQLEQFIAGILKNVPERAAPAVLEARVLQVLAARAARPWWLQGFSRWPWIARSLFLPLSVGFVQLAFVATGRLSVLGTALRHSTIAVSARAEWLSLSQLRQALHSLIQTLVHDVSHGVPTLWFYGGAGAIFALYAALFGLGAAAFRTFIVTSAPIRY